MLKKLVLILLTAAAAGPAFSAATDDDDGLFSEPLAECECQRYGVCPIADPTPPPKPPRPK